jgi:aconitate hydratase
VKAVITELRAHPPLEPHRHGRRAAAVPRGPVRRALGSDGTEIVSIEGLEELNNGTTPKTGSPPRASSRPRARRRSSSTRVRIDTPGEADYYRNGGILQYVLRSLV